MLTFEINGRSFEIEFRHRRKNLVRPERSEFYARSPVFAVTTCAVRGTNDNGHPYICIGTAVCVEPDNWARPTGRLLAFDDVIQKCGMLRPFSAELRMLLIERFQLRSPVAQSAKLTPEEKALRREEGRDLREARQVRRDHGRLTAAQVVLLQRPPSNQAIAELERRLSAWRELARAIEKSARKISAKPAAS